MLQARHPQQLVQHGLRRREQDKARVRNPSNLLSQSAGSSH
jgi:hypothetical protein